MNEQAKSAAEELDVNMNSQQGNSGQSKKKFKSKIVAIAAVLVAIVVVAAIAGCSSEPTKTVTLEWLSVEVPEDCTVEYEENEYEYLGDWEDVTIHNWDDGGNSDSFFTIYISGPFEIEDYETEFETNEESTEDSLPEDGYVVTSETFNEDDAIVQRISYAYENSDDDEYSAIWGNTGCYQYVYSGNEYIFIWCISSEEEAYETVLDSMTLENPSAPA